MDVFINFCLLDVVFFFFAQASASDARVDQSTGLFDGSSDMFRVSVIALVGVLGVAICIGLAHHYVVFLPRKTKGKRDWLCLQRKILMEATLVRKETYNDSNCNKVVT